MGIADTPEALRRAWHVRVEMLHDRPHLTCTQCGPLPQPEDFPVIRSSILTHLSGHARRELLEEHLRTCRCGERGCPWHPRHRGCAGPVALALTRVGRGRMWRLADMCLACTAATPCSAAVSEPPQKTAHRPGGTTASAETGEIGPGAYLFEDGWEGADGSTGTDQR